MTQTDRQTIGIADLGSCPESKGDTNASEHEKIIDFGDVYLAGVFVGGVDDFDTREASEGERLLDDGEGGRDHSLASDD